MRNLLCYMHHGKAFCDIQVWLPANPSWVSFRGPPYHLWDEQEPCPAKIFHDALEGWHTSVLHAGEVLLLHEKHPDFERAWEMFNAC